MAVDKEVTKVKAGPGPVKPENRKVGGRSLDGPVDVQGLTELIRRHPADHRKRSRLAMALLKQGSIEQAIDQFNAAICIADEEVDARFQLACQLIDCGQMDGALRALREASRIRLQRAMIRYALETTYYDHSIIELAMDEWKAILGPRGDASTRVEAKHAAQGHWETPLGRGTCGDQRPVGPDGPGAVGRRLGR